jgi:integrase
MNSIRQKGKRFYLRGTFGGKRQEIPLGMVKRDATTKANRFLVSLETQGFQKALEELNGKNILKKGHSPTLEQVAEAYREFCKMNPSEAPRPTTIEHNISSLRRIMAKAGAETIGEIESEKLASKWTGTTLTPSQQRSFYSAVKAAGSIFKRSALAWYEKNEIPLKNPFKVAVKNPKVKAYAPIDEEARNAIWNDCKQELPPAQAMIVLLALGAGLRRTEITAMRCNWITKQADKATIEVSEEPEFIPKSGQSGTVPISLSLYSELMALRERTGMVESEFFVPVPPKQKRVKLGEGGEVLPRVLDEKLTRLWEHVREVNKWLKKKSPSKDLGIHDLRKEFGSIIAKKQGILAAAKVLRNTPQVCETHYAGISNVEPVEMGATQRDPLQEMAESMGVSVADLKKHLAKLKK